MCARTYMRACVCVVTSYTVTHVNGERRTNMGLAPAINQDPGQSDAESPQQSLRCVCHDPRCRDEETKTRREKGPGHRQPRTHHLPTRQPTAHPMWLLAPSNRISVLFHSFNHAFLAGRDPVLWALYPPGLANTGHDGCGYPMHVPWLLQHERSCSEQISCSPASFS